ncbi:MAG: hypothetical protein PHO12_07820 [Bacteroidales bacterium]|nr:hypothetical protein [Bacteroidales bacterium]
MALSIENINRAKSVNLELFCPHKKICLIPTNCRLFAVSGYSNLYVTCNTYLYYEGRKETSGDAVDFCRTFLGMKKNQAVNELLSFQELVDNETLPK